VILTPPGDQFAGGAGPLRKEKLEAGGQQAARHNLPAPWRITSPGSA